MMFTSPLNFSILAPYEALLFRPSSAAFRGIKFFASDHSVLALKVPNPVRRFQFLAAVFCSSIADVPKLFPKRKFPESATVLALERLKVRFPN